MDVEEYSRIIEAAKRLDKSLFDLSSEEKIDRLEAILEDESKKHDEIMIGVPLVPPYGMPSFEYIILPKRLYDEMRIAMRAWKINDVHRVVGVPYDKKRFDINREQLQKGFKIFPEYSKFMERIRRTAKKIEVYKKT